MTWVDRLRPVIKMTSPKKDIFEPLWIGNSLSMEKSLGIFKFPKVKGVKIQDLDVGGISYPLTINFEGEDNDLEVVRFMKAAKETGLWEIIHPVLGKLNLQLVSISPSINPVESGNITQVKTEWLDPGIDEVKITPLQIAASIDDQSILTNIISNEQLENNINQDDPGLTAFIGLEATKLITVITKSLKNLYEPVAELNNSITSIVRSVQSTLTETTIDIVALGGQIQRLIQLPALANDDIQQRLATYSGMIASVFDLLPDSDEPKDKNSVALNEVVLSAAIVAIAQINSTGLLKTRAQAINAVEASAQLFSDITDNLDNVQGLFSDNDIDTQYFSQSSSFSDSAKITTLGVSYLLLASFDLSIEKVFVLEYPRAPIEITITEYGGLGDNDENFDLFIKSNSLKGDDISLLPAGREVVVYV